MHDESAEPPDDCLRGASLMARHRSDDKLAFGEIYEWQYPKVLRFLSRTTVSPHTAEVLSHETFVNLHRTLALPINPIKCLSPYCRSIARNLLMDHFRHTLRESRLFRPFNSESDDAATTSSDVEQLIDLFDWLRQMLTTLSEVQREVLSKLYVEEKSTQQVADELELSRERIGQIRRQLVAELRKRFNVDFAQ